MIEELRRICELQPAYSSENTQPMQERSRLIRHGLPAELRSLGPELISALGPFGDDFAIGASDGIGRKTEAPWVRIFSQRMSPNPRDGFYVVIHFAADGSALFVTVGCGSTIWANGELRAVSDAELKRRTDWARAVVTEAFGTTAPFGDVIRLGARAPLPRTFEKATALARRVPVNELDESSIRDMIIGATARLRCLYEAQRIGRDRSPAEKVEIELENLSRPGRRGQGFGLTGPERKVVEDRAMKLAREWFEEREYVVENTSLTFPFDYRVQKDGRALKVEVKGTTSDFCDAIIMTHNEVKLHREEAGSTALIIVSGIRLERGADGPVAQGGELHADIGWDIGTWDLAPVAYRVSKPTAS